MKQPKLNDLSIDWKATARMRSKMAEAKKLTITINVDRSALAFLGKLSARDRKAYQTLVAGALKRNSITPLETERRLSTVEQELIPIRFQDEPKYGRVEAWEDHGGSTGEQ